MADRLRLLLTHAHGGATDFGWHEADALYAEAFGDIRGLRSLHGLSRGAAATAAWWALRPLLLSPRQIAAHCVAPIDDVAEAADFLYHLIRGCHEHGFTGTMEVTL